MEMGLAELMDRYSICCLKRDRANVVTEELKALEDAINETLFGNIDFEQHESFLYLVNGAIWTLESDLRKGKEGELGLEEVGRRAIQIRNWNALRVFLKNDITRKFNNGFLEIKKDHASA